MIFLFFGGGGGGGGGVFFVVVVFLLSKKKKIYVDIFLVFRERKRVLLTHITSGANPNYSLVAYYEIYIHHISNIVLNTAFTY